jgi:pimeloyl-ACP methyl ester carboxylesterase
MRTSFSFGCIAAIAGLLALTGVGSAAAAAQRDAIAYGDNAAAGKTFVFNGNRFYYETYGRGSPILLIHGNGESIGEFKGQIGEFARRHLVIAMDSRGQGKSELGATALSYEGMAEDVNALLEHLERNHVKVLGQSDGGIIGLLLAIHHPDKVGMLAVMGANLQPDAAYPWAVDGIVRMRNRISAELAHSDEHTLSIFHAIPQSQLAIFPGATHVIAGQDPARFNRTVLDFFDKPFAMPDTKDLGWFD